MMARWFVVGWGLLFMCVGAWVVVQPRGLGAFIAWSVWPRRTKP